MRCGGGHPKSFATPLCLPCAGGNAGESKPQLKNGRRAVVKKLSIECDLLPYNHSPKEAQENFPPMGRDNGNVLNFDGSACMSPAIPRTRRRMRALENMIWQFVCYESCRHHGCQKRQHLPCGVQAGLRLSFTDLTVGVRDNGNAGSFRNLRHLWAQVISGENGRAVRLRYSNGLFSPSGKYAESAASRASPEFLGKMKKGRGRVLPFLCAGRGRGSARPSPGKLKARTTHA